MTTKGEVWKAQTNAERKNPVLDDHDADCPHCWGTGVCGWQYDAIDSMSTMWACDECGDAVKRNL